MQTTAISYITGDATDPRGTGPKVIVHVCNDIGGWGRGFVLALSARWPEPKIAYRCWHREGEAGGFALGAVRFVEVESYLWVANLIGQHGIHKAHGVPPVRYEAIQVGLGHVADFAEKQNATVHMPRMGCGLASGEWGTVEGLIVSELCGKGIDVTVYDLPTK
ncbi:hypothetical protein OT109_01610 [Phycisphaeraceae bacterium D3-23]